MSRLLGLMVGMIVVCGAFWVFIQAQGAGTGLQKPKAVLAPFVEKVSSRFYREEEAQGKAKTSAAEEMPAIQGAGSKPAREQRKDPVAVSGEEAPGFFQDKSAGQPSVSDGALPDTEAGTSEDQASAGPVITSWQVFWTPFRTKRSATGFAARIHDLTGLTLDVQEAGHGKYQVCFAYTDEEERQLHMKLIEEQTRLSIFQGKGFQGERI